jgi:hypothetical protein
LSSKKRDAFCRASSAQSATTNTPRPLDAAAATALTSAAENMSSASMTSKAP